VSVFLTVPGTEGLAPGVGVAFEQSFSQRWSVELAATREQRRGLSVLGGAVGFSRLASAGGLKPTAPLSKPIRQPL
jgi:hypothetical protein